MKRSKMIQKISYYTQEDKDLAKRCLDMLEQMGMLPPICKVVIKDGKHTPTERRWDNEEI